ncbi:uncharacterized protein LOC131284695 [Anopheles ziemanni]|uniref:uncharacterized protein LOC131284695 n=1 Tax=Anopheles ziemanni TaxID=345580 RepID=UPI00265EEB53|nr:uncharacterized protein LOC131284695 [Anopheles ziemanni]
MVTFLLGLTLAEQKNATEQSVAPAAGAKEKRQTEHETRSIPLSLIANRRQQQAALHHQQQQEYYQSEEAAGPFYGAQPSGGQVALAYKSVAGQKAGASQEQPQYQELPPEYISLLHQLAEHQPKAAAVKQGKAVSQQFEPQSHAQHSKPNQVQYITEEEYAQLLKQAQQQSGPAGPPPPQHQHQLQQPPQQHHQHHQHQAPPQGLQAYGRPSAHPGAPHKYRPSIQLLETGEDQPGAYGQPDGEQYRVQYKSIQQAGSVTPVPKPVSSFSFEKELAKLVESNRPIAYHHPASPHHPGRHEAQHDGQRYGPTPSPQSHEYTYVQAGGPAHDHGAPPQQPKQSIKAQYIAPFAQGLPLTGPKISPAHLQVGPQRFVDSPAQKYQFIGNPEAGSAKSHHHAQQLHQQQQQQQHHHHQAPAHQGQQYLTEVSPKQLQGTPSPKIQYYIPKEKNVQVYYQQAQQQQLQQQQQQQQQHHLQQAYEQHSPQHPMKIVEAPQLQNEKPQKTVQSHHRSKPAEQQQQQQQHRYAAREKQPEASPVSSDPHAPSRSAIFVSQSTGVNQATAAATPAPAGAHYGGEKHAHKIPPKIDRPLTQEEFQALVDAGYSVVPVPVPVPVPISQYQQHQQQAGGHPGAGRAGGPHPTPASSAARQQAAQASRYHLHQLATAENNPNQVVTYLRPLHLDPFSAGVRGPHKAAP